MTDKPKTIEGDPYWLIKGNDGTIVIELEHEYVDSETGQQCAYMQLTDDDLKAMLKLLEG